MLKVEVIHHDGNRITAESTSFADVIDGIVDQDGRSLELNFITDGTYMKQTDTFFKSENSSQY